MKQYYKKLKILLSPVKLIKKEYSGLLFIGLCDGFQSIFVIQIMAYIVHAIQNKNLYEFNYWIVIFVIIQIFSGAIMYLGNHAFSNTWPKLFYGLSDTYLARFLKLDNNKIESLGTGRANSILSKGIDHWCFILLENFSDIFINIFAILYAFGVIYFTAGIKYFLIVTALFTVAFLWAFYFNNLGLKYRDKRKNEEVVFDGHFIKVIMSKFEILQNNKFYQESKKLKDITSNILKFWWKEDDRGIIGTFGVKFLISALLFTVYMYIGKGVINGKFEISYFVLIYGLVNVLEQYTWMITRSIRKVGIRLINVDKLLETFEDIKEIKGIDNPIPFIYSKGNIKIDSLNFGYQDDNIFNDFSLELAGGKKTAFVGNSGSGKTTLMKLIAGYIYPKSGNISVDDQNIQDVNLISYYKHIGYLTQEPSVFDGTIKENLLYAMNGEPEEKEIEKVIKSSKCEFIYDLPNGFDTEIGERGIKLSGGQKQRLAIAKIMLKNPNIILLDEPTSALDSISEQIVSEALQNLFVGRTVIVIAHRLQTVKEADEIIVLKKGKIIERGTHEELSKVEGGEYKKMLDLQTSF